MRYVIWSLEHQAWWGPERRGYTASLRDAGQYSETEASAIVADANIVSIEDIMIPLASCLGATEAFFKP